MIATSDRVLEIGPFTRPLLRGPHVKYFDVLDKAGLIARAAAVNYQSDTPVEIDYVSPTGDLSVITETFDTVVSSHCIEHQPDLIGHLQKVAAVLRPSGRYLLIVPDKRYCFDHFIPESTMASIIAAYVERRTLHTLENVIAHRALTTHNEAARHWYGDHGTPAFHHSYDALLDAIEQFECEPRCYIDVHAWQLTPAGFASLLKTAYEAGLSSFRAVHISDTPYGSLEFCAVLERAA